MTAKKEVNVLGGTLETCSLRPLTGFFRDGDCRLGLNDYGRHGVCAQVTDAFLKFTQNRENDLSIPLPMANFPGLKPGDRWCLCVDRWQEAEANGFAPGDPCRHEQRGVKPCSFGTVKAPCPGRSIGWLTAKTEPFTIGMLHEYFSTALSAL